MADNKILAMSFAGAAGFLSLILLFVPWWTVTFDPNDTGKQIGADDVNESAGPFDTGEIENEDLIGSGDAAMAGMMTLFAFFAFGTAAAFFAVSRFARPRPEGGAPRVLGMIAPWVALGGSFFLLLVALLAPLSWPEEMSGEEIGFWDSKDVEFQGANIGKGSSYATFGWYAAIVTALAGGAAVLFGLLRGPSQPYYAPAGWGTPPQPMGAYGQSVGGQPMAAGGWGAQPQQQPMPQYQPRAPPPPPPPVAPHQQQIPPSGVATSIPCPRCHNIVQAPPYRPVMLTCPTCGFGGRLDY